MRKTACRIGFLFMVVITTSLFLSKVLAPLFVPSADFLKPLNTTIRREYLFEGVIELLEKSDVYHEDAQFIPIQIERVFVKPGDAFKKGDVLFEFKYFESLEQKINELYILFDKRNLDRLSIKEKLEYENLDVEGVQVKNVITLLNAYKEVNSLERLLTSKYKYLNLDVRFSEIIDTSIFEKEDLQLIDHYKKLLGTIEKLSTKLVAPSKHSYDKDFSMAKELYEINREIEYLEKKISILQSVDSSKSLVKENLRKLELKTLERADIKGRLTQEGYSFNSDFESLAFKYFRSEREYLECKILFSSELLKRGIEFDNSEFLSLDVNDLEEESIINLWKTYEKRRMAYLQCEEELFKKVKGGQRINFSLVNEWLVVNNEIESIKHSLDRYINLKANTVVCAKADGLVTDVLTYVGHLYKGNQPIMKMVENSTPYIAVEAAGIEFEAISTENKYRLIVNDEEYECNFINKSRKVVDAEGRYLFKPEFLFWNSYDNLIDLQGQKVTIKSEAPVGDSSNVYPTKVLIKQGNNYYIYIVKLTRGIWGEAFVAKKIKVQILSHNDQFVSIDYFVSDNEYVLSNWSRPVEDGYRVIRYGY